MAIVTICDDGRTLRDVHSINAYLGGIGIGYEQWTPSSAIGPDQPADDVLAAYSEEIDKLKARGGYITADVIDVSTRTAGLEEMLAKFNREHWHDEDEVRFVIDGRGLFHIRARDGSVTAIEVEAGDLISVPRATWHWFNLCSDRRIRAIRLFQDVAGWTPHYTSSQAESNYAPVCFGQSYLPLGETPTSVE
jgi:1,2-dihydroxy-3-keto-5-methylthiopentene dioxygenase